MSLARKTEECLANLSATDQTQFLSQALRRSPNACVWIQEDQRFVQWQEDTSPSLLWVTAKAGCGKTTVAAHVCQMISQPQTSEEPALPGNDHTRVLLYFFFQRSNHASVRTASAAIRTLIGQYVHQVPAALPILLKRHDSLSAKGDFDWSWETLSGVFSEMLRAKSLISKVCIIVDALDESEDESRTLMLDWLKGLVDKEVTSIALPGPKLTLKLLVTGRPDGDLLDQLSAYPTLEITETDTVVDIRALISNRMEEFGSRRNLKPAVTKHIIQFLELNARGMFLWAVLVMNELERRDERLSDEVIASKLSTTPLTLIDVYESILRNVPTTRKQDMWRMFRWLLFGSRSLTLIELETALCLEVGISSWHDFAGDLKFLCGSLVRWSGPHDQVEFVHQTARDFLEAYSQSSSSAVVEGLAMDANGANETLAGTCARYLLKNEHLIQKMNRHLLRWQTRYNFTELAQSLLDEHPFSCYATLSWAFHARGVRTPSRILSITIYRLLNREIRRDFILTVTYFFSKELCVNVPVDQTPLHLAAYFNVPWLVQMYISQDSASVHATTPMNDTPLIWASEMGSTESAQLLLDSGADPNHSEIDGWSALHWAARNGHTAITKLLLEHGARLNQRDRNGHTPLDWAIDREHWEVAGVLRRWSSQDELDEVDYLPPFKELRERGESMHANQHKWQLWDSRP